MKSHVKQNREIVENKLSRVLFYCLCITIPFENTALESIGGVFTAPLSIVLIPFIFLFLLLTYRKHGRATKTCLNISTLFLLFSVCYVAFIVNDYGLGFLLDRGIRFFIITIPLLVVFSFVISQSDSTIKSGVKVIFFIVLASFFINLLVPTLSNSPWLLQHNQFVSPHRMRGFTLEASTFGFQFVLACLMYLVIVKKNALIFVPLILLACLTITSKGAVMMLIISVGLTAIIFNGRNIVFKTLTLIASLCFITILLSFTVLDALMSDIENYTSVSTRTTVILTSFVSLVNAPLGHGYFGFLPAIYENGAIAMKLMDSWFPNSLNFMEFHKYLVVGNVEGVSTKSFFFDWVIFGGFIFIYFYFKFVFSCMSICKKNQDQNLCQLLFFLMLSTMFFMSIEARYIAPFAIGFLYARCHSVKNY